MTLLAAGDFFKFNLQWDFNFWTFILTLIYLAFLGGGYYLISNQVKLVKKEIWTNLDRFKCFVYAVFFAGGCEIIIAMMITFATRENYAFTAPFIVIPYFYNLILMTFYPLADFLYMAKSKQELARSPPHAILEKYIINKFAPPFSFIAAIVLYFIIFILPPLLIIMVGGHEFIIVWTSWQMIFPMGIITYYGSKGFITGLVNDYNRLPRLNRSMFLAFENGSRAKHEFERDPVCRIMLPLRFYLYFWTMYSFYTTIIRINPSRADAGFNTLSYGFTVYLVLFFGVTGYFSRFWGRRTKFKTMDIMYAAFLIAAVGINVMVNFVIANPSLLQVPLSEWQMAVSISEDTGFKFALAATIEEVILTILITHYVGFTVKKGFVNDTIHSFITQSEEFFDPIFSFNMIKNRDPKKRDHAQEALERIYDRVPGKKGYFLNSPEFKDPLFDAVCEYDPYAQEIGKDILGNLVEDYPNKVKGLIEEAIFAPNYDKAINTLDVVLERGSKLIPILNISLFFELLDHPDYNIRGACAKILNKYYANLNDEQKRTDPTDAQINFLIDHLEDPDYNVQAKILKTLVKFTGRVPNYIFSERLDHPIDKIRSIAANSVGAVDLSSLGTTAIPKLIEMLNSPNPEIQGAVMKTLANIGDFKENKIPIEPFKEGIIDQNPDVREGALKGYLIYTIENPEELDLDYFIKKLKTETDEEIISNLLKLIGESWSSDEMKVFQILLPYIKSESIAHQNIVKDYIITIADVYPDEIINTLVKTEDTEGILKKGKVAQALIDVGKHSPGICVPILMKSLDSTNETAKINSSSALSELAPENADMFDLKPILELWLAEKSSKVKKNLAKVFASVSKKKIHELKRYMPLLLKGLSDNDTSVRLTIAKMLLDIGKNVKGVVPLSATKQMLNDADEFIRENGMKLLGIVGSEFPEEAFHLVLNALNDKSDIVKTAAADALTEMGQNIESDEINNEIKELINSSSKWARLAALDVIIMISKKNPGFISMEEIQKYFKDQDITFRSKSTNLVESLSKERFNALSSRSRTQPCKVSASTLAPFRSTT